MAIYDDPCVKTDFSFQEGVIGSRLRRSESRERFPCQINRSRNKKKLQNNHRLLGDGTHKIWDSPLFKNMRANNWYAALRKKCLCCGCMVKLRAIKA